MSRLKNTAIKFLRWSQQYTKTDMVYLASGMSWLTSGQIVSSIAAFGLSIAFANLFPKETFGTYRFVLSVCAILSIPTLEGIGTAVIRAVARGNDGALKRALKIKLMWGTLTSIGGIATSLYYYLNGNMELTISFLIVALFAPFVASFNVYSSLLQGKRKFKTSSIFQSATTMGSAIVMLMTLSLTDNLFIVLLAYFVPWTVLRFLFLKLVLRKYVDNNNTDDSSITFGKHLSLMGILNTIAMQIDKILLFHYLGPAELAIYTFALAIPEQIKGPIKSVAALALPKFVQKNRKELSNLLGRKFIILLCTLLAITAIYIPVAPFIYKILFPSYSDAIFLSQIFSISLVAVALFIPLSALQSQIDTKRLYIFNVTTAIIQIITSFIFIYFFGLIGAVIGRVIVRFLNLVISVLLFRSLTHQSS